MIRFFVPGIPRPAGSKTGIPIYRGPRSGKRTFTGKVAMIDSSGEKGKYWRANCQHAAKQIYLGNPVPHPLIVSMHFVSQRPKNHFGTGSKSEVLKDSAPPFNVKRPDILKLCRAVEDSLTGIIWDDDSQIVEEHLTKAYGEKPGVHIKIEIKQKDPSELFGEKKIETLPF